MRLLGDKLFSLATTAAAAPSVGSDSVKGRVAENERMISLSAFPRMKLRNGDMRRKFTKTPTG